MGSREFESKEGERDDGRSSELNDLVVEFLERQETEADEALEALCRAHPEHADGLRRRVGMLAEIGLLADEEPEDEAFPERLGDFQLVRRLGGGGMGVVYLARQESLEREVALKLVRPEQLYFEGARERFRREVTTIARLNHPGIVPVHLVGEENGVPYFAMEHVHGATLADALERLAGRKPALTGADLDRAIAEFTGEEPEGELAPLFAGTWTETCLRILREVSEALEHAHRSGVVHRDLKPSNVMITRGGRVMLLDFGLSSEEGVDRLTRTGSQVGSLPYMAPEQLDGTSEPDRRSDVYSLGVTFYELLTLRLPYRETSVIALRERVLAARPEAIRGLNSGVSWEAETVCLTAMERDAERRYASAEDLARDASNVLERRPIAARRAGAALRTRRWVERHPAWSVGLALGFLLVVVGPSVLAWREYRASERIAAKSAEVAQANAALSQTLDEVREQRERAERNFERAYQAVELMLSRVGGEELEQVPGMAEVRRSLLADALEFHEQFLAEGSDDPEQRRLHVDTLHRIAGIHALLNEFEESVAVLRGEREFLEALLETDPSPSLFVRLGACWHRESEARKLAGHFDDAEAAALRAIEILEPLSVEGGHGWGALGQARVQLGDVLQRRGRVQEGREVLLAALPDLRAALAQDPDSVEDRRELGRALNVLATSRDRAVVANVQDEERMLADEAWLLEAIEHRGVLLDLAPGPASTQHLADSCNSLGATYMSLSRTQEARAMFERALELFEPLTDDYPHVSFYTEGLATTVMNLGMLERFYELEPGYGPRFQRALVLFEELSTRHPESELYASMFFYALCETAAAFADDERDFPRALAVADRAIAQGEALRARSRAPFAVLHKLAYSNDVRARALVMDGKHAESAEALRKRLAIGVMTDAYSLAYGAWIFALCASAARTDSTLGSACDEVAATYSAQANELMLQALEGGLTSEELTQIADPDIAPFRALPSIAGMLVEFGFGSHLDGE